MDQPPPNYNPNDSMLSGGIETITKVMGGGGVPPGYNETLSLLDGGIEPIVKVEGGATPDPSPGSQVTPDPSPGSQDTSVHKKKHKHEPREPKEYKGSKELNVGIGSADNIKQEEEAQRNSRHAMKDSINNEKWEKRGIEKEDEKKRKERYYAKNHENVGNLGSIFTNQGNNSAFVKDVNDIPTNEINVRYVTEYDIEPSDKTLFTNFLTKLKNIGDVNAKMQKDIAEKEGRVPIYEYIKSRKDTNDYDVTIPKDISKYIKIKFIPVNTNNIIVLPHTPDNDTFLKLLYFLLDNKYITINANKELIIKKNTVLIHLIYTPLLTPLTTGGAVPAVAPAVAPVSATSESILYFYLKLKSSNIDKYFVPDYPYKIIYPGEKPLLFSTELKKPDATHLEPNNNTIIHKKYIKKMAYLPTNDTYTSEFSKIYSGIDVDTTITTIPDPLTLTKNIAIIEVKASDYNTITIDINGMNYRIRIPDGKYDKVYSSWEKASYKYDEAKLIKQLHADDLGTEKIAKFLFEIAYFKCFNDISLLTKQECSSMRETLQILYMKMLKQDESEADIEEPLGPNEEVVMENNSSKSGIENIECFAKDTTNNTIRCTYTKDGLAREIIIPYDEAIHDSSDAGKKKLKDMIEAEIQKKSTT